MERLNELEKKILDDYMAEIIKNINYHLSRMDFSPKLSMQAKQVILKYISVSDYNNGDSKFQLCLGINGNMLNDELELYIKKQAIDRFIKGIENKE